MAKLLNYFTTEKDGFRVSKDYEKIEILIPDQYFKTGIAKQMGTKILTLGIVNVVVYPKKGTVQILQMSLPIKMSFNTDEDMFKQDYELDGKPVLFNVCTIYSGNYVINDTKHIQSLFNSIDFVNWFNGGKIADTVPYTGISNIFVDAARMNGIGLGVPKVLIDIMISEMCRDADQPAMPYRFRVNKSGKDDGAYKFIPIKQIPQTSSVLAALAFEDIGKSLRNAVVQTESGVEQRTSPIEKMLHF